MQAQKGYLDQLGDEGGPRSATPNAGQEGALVHFSGGDHRHRSPPSKSAGRPPATCMRPRRRTSTLMFIALLERISPKRFTDLDGALSAHRRSPQGAHPARSGLTWATEATVSGNVYISDTWQGHPGAVTRPRPSRAPTTPSRSADPSTPPAPATWWSTSRRPTATLTGEPLRQQVRLDDGRTVRYLHLQAVSVWNGLRVARGDVLGLSGASANGSDYGVGAHVHTTLWPGAAWQAPTIDFELYVGDDPKQPPPEEDDDMPKNSGFYYTRKSDNRTVWFVTNPTGLFMEWSDSTITVDPIAAAFDTGPFARVTQGWRDAMKASLDAVQVPSAPSTSTTFSMSWWVVGLIGVVLVAEIVLGVLLGVLPR